jgi:hypothetical protein
VHRKRCRETRLLDQRQTPAGRVNCPKAGSSVYVSSL